MTNTSAWEFLFLRPRHDKGGGLGQKKKRSGTATRSFAASKLHFALAVSKITHSPPTAWMETIIAALYTQHSSTFSDALWDTLSELYGEYLFFRSIEKRLSGRTGFVAAVQRTATGEKLPYRQPSIHSLTHINDWMILLAIGFGILLK